MRRYCAETFEDGQDLAGEDQIRRAAVSRRNFHVLPTNSTPPACLQRLQGRFFRREARGIMLRGHDAATLAIFAFGAREHAIGKARRAQQHFANSRNFDNVYADGNNHERSRIKWSWILLARARRRARACLPAVGAGRFCKWFFYASRWR